MFAFAAVLLGPMAALGIALVVIDLREHRLPNRLVLPLYPLGLGTPPRSRLGGFRWRRLSAQPRPPPSSSGRSTCSIAAAGASAGAT